MEDCSDKLITAVIGCIFGIITYICTRKLDKWGHKRNYSSLGVTVIDSILKEIEEGLDIMKKEQKIPLPKESWKGEKTIQDEVMLIILALSKSENKAEDFSPNEIKRHCKHYFEIITQHWQKILDDLVLYKDLQKILKDHEDKNTEVWQNIQKDIEYAENLIKMLKSTKSSLKENSKKCCPK